MSELRVAVVGVSGAGKSSFSQALRSETQLPYLELDGLYHQPDWTPSPPEVMRTAVFEFMQTHSSWVIDGNYGIVRSAIWAKATHVVWLDLPKRMIMQRLLKRSVRRIATKEVLWNDDRKVCHVFLRYFELNLKMTLLFNFMIYYFCYSIRFIKLLIVPIF